MRVTILVGGMWGLEGKGNIAAHLTAGYQVSARAGRSDWLPRTVPYDGVLYETRYLPSGWVNPDQPLVIPPGAVVDLDWLEREIALIDDVVPVEDRLTLDPYAMTVPGFIPVRGQCHSVFAHCWVSDTRALMEEAESVFLEGEGGYAASYVSGGRPIHFNPTAPAIAASNGIWWGEVEEVILALRTLPVYHDRKLAYFDEDLISEGILRNQATRIAVTFMDSLAPACRGQRALSPMVQNAWGFLHFIEHWFDLPVCWVGTGPFTGLAPGDAPFED